MKLLCLSLSLVLSILAMGQSTVTTDELKSIIGNWNGTITYIDYQSNNPFTMPANVKVEQGKDDHTLILNNIYPNEPKANDTEKVKLSTDGSELNKHPITGKKALENGGIEIQTEHQGKDDRRDAIIRYTYSLSIDVFIILKEVKFEDSEKWIKRSEYSYRRS